MSAEKDVELAQLLEEVRRIEIQARRLVTDVMSGGYSSAFRGAGIEFKEVREYVPGDDPRSVDWNVTARQGRPFVKKYVDERELTVLFLLDLSPSMTSGFGPLSARQMAARICACLALSAVRNNDQVGLIAFGAQVERFVPPDKGLGHVLRIIRDCLALRAETTTTTDIAAVLDFTSRVVKRKATVFLVSDFMDDGWRDSLARCASRHDVVAVRVMPPELEPQKGGMMRLIDPESKATSVVDFAYPAARDAYSANVAAWRARTEENFRRAGVDLMDVPVPRMHDKDAIARPILRFFRMRQMKGTKS